MTRVWRAAGVMVAFGEGLSSKQVGALDFSGAFFVGAGVYYPSAVELGFSSLGAPCAGVARGVLESLRFRDARETRIENPNLHRAGGEPPPLRGKVGTNVCDWILTLQG
jgi:hypothetical protein